MSKEKTGHDIQSTGSKVYTDVINPYALAELVAGRKINWKEVPDKRKVLVDTSSLQ